MGLIHQKRRLKASRLRRQINSTRMLLQRFRILLSLLLIGIISYFCYWTLKLPQWRIDTVKLMNADPSVVKIQGNIITPNYKIINIIKQTEIPNTQIFKLDTSELEKNISQLQPIKKVYVRRYWFPARLVIAVDERTPAFLLAPNLESEPNSALTTDGVLIGHDYLPFNPNISAKKLLTYGISNGVDVVWDKKKVDELIKIINVIETCSKQQVQYIDLRNEKDIYIMLQQYLIRFGEINDTSVNRAKSIAALLSKAKNYKVNYIDLRWDDSKYFSLQGEKKQEAVSKKKDETKEEPKKEIKEKKQENIETAQPQETQETEELQGENN